MAVWPSEHGSLYLYSICSEVILMGFQIVARRAEDEATLLNENAELLNPNLKFRLSSSRGLPRLVDLWVNLPGALNESKGRFQMNPR